MGIWLGLIAAWLAVVNGCLAVLAGWLSGRTACLGLQSGFCCQQTGVDYYLAVFACCLAGRVGLVWCLAGIETGLMGLLAVSGLASWLAFLSGWLAGRACSLACCACCLAG